MTSRTPDQSSGVSPYGWVITSMRCWRDPPESWHVFLLLETICVVVFGVSWLIEGGFVGILADKKSTPAPAVP
jgi:putative exporter of polyketide antibiotics